MNLKPNFKAVGATWENEPQGAIEIRINLGVVASLHFWSGFTKVKLQSVRLKPFLFKE